MSRSAEPPRSRARAKRRNLDRLLSEGHQGRAKPHRNPLFFPTSSVSGYKLFKGLNWEQATPNLVVARGAPFALFSGRCAAVPAEGGSGKPLERLQLGGRRPPLRTLAIVIGPLLGVDPPISVQRSPLLCGRTLQMPGSLTGPRFAPQQNFDILRRKLANRTKKDWFTPRAGTGFRSRSKN